MKIVKNIYPPISFSLPPMMTFNAQCTNTKPKTSRDFTRPVLYELTRVYYIFIELLFKTQQKSIVIECSQYLISHHGRKLLCSAKRKKTKQKKRRKSFYTRERRPVLYSKFEHPPNSHPPILPIKS